MSSFFRSVDRDFQFLWSLRGISEGQQVFLDPRRISNSIMVDSINRCSSSSSSSLQESRFLSRSLTSSLPSPSPLRASSGSLDRWTAHDVSLCPSMLSTDFFLVVVDDSEHDVEALRFLPMILVSINKMHGLIQQNELNGNESSTTILNGLYYICSKPLRFCTLVSDIC